MNLRSTSATLLNPVSEEGAVEGICFPANVCLANSLDFLVFFPPRSRRVAIHPLLSKFRQKSSSSNRSAARQRRKDKEEPTRGKMTAHAQWQERKERDEPTADDHKLPQSSHFYACFSMLEPKYVMGYCLSQLGEKAPELIRPPPQVTERLAFDSFAPHASPPARDAQVATIC